MMLTIGHTSGIGEAIYKLLGGVGVSRSTGYDINYENVFDYSKFSCIVLSAYGDFTSQLKTLFNIIEDPSFNKDTLVIVISSINAFRTFNVSVSRTKYSVEKQAINSAAHDLVVQGYNISTICPGYVDTEYNRDKVDPKIQPAQVAILVKQIKDSFENMDILCVEHVFKKIN